MQGYAQYLTHQTKEVHLYGPKHPPTWLNKLRSGVRFLYHNSQKLLGSEDVPGTIKTSIRMHTLAAARMPTRRMAA